jgi:chromosome segregation ATPase
VCCTPEALTAAELRAETLGEDAAYREDECRDLRADLLDAREELGAAEERILELEEEVKALNENRDDLQPAFEDYLVSVGLPANPVTLEHLPKLKALADAIAELGE